MESADKTSSRGCGRKTWNGVNERQEERREEGKRNENRKGGRRRREERKTERTGTNKPVENSRPGNPRQRLNDEREKVREKERRGREGEEKEEREVWITFRKGVVCGWE